MDAIGGLSMGRWESRYHCLLGTERLLHGMRRLLWVGDGDVCIMTRVCLQLWNCMAMNGYNGEGYTIYMLLQLKESKDL